MKRRGRFVPLAVLMTCALAAPLNAFAQQPDDVPAQNVSIPPLPVDAYGQTLYPVADPGVALSGYQGRFLSPKCEPGRCGACERASGCCLLKSISKLCPCSCLKKSEGCACPPHFFCPRGHCRVRQTECVRIDYRPYETVMDPKPKKTADEIADYTKAKESQAVAIDLYPVYEECCQDFWLHDDLMYADDLCSECSNCP